MLNELKSLSDSIKAAGFYGEEWNDKFKEIKVKGAPCFVISLSNEGEIADIRFLTPERAKVLRTWQGGSNGECFPAFNFIPFYELVEDSKNPISTVQKNNEMKEFTETFISSEEPPLNVCHIRRTERTKADKKTGKCLGSIAKDFFAIMTRNVDNDDIFVQFKTAFAKLSTGNLVDDFNRKLLSYLRKNLSPEMSQQKDTTIWSLLFCRTSDVVLFFDYANTTSFPIASEHSIKTINSRLVNDKSATSSISSKDVTDAFGQQVSSNELTEKLPEVKLPGVLANTKLRSMSSESRCQTRYGFIDAVSFPVGAEIRKAMKSALTWISSPEREGKTWAIAGANELVFAYPKMMQKSLPPLARLFGNGRSSLEEQIEASFQEYAQTALKGIKSLSQEPSPNVEIEIFAIKKADKARRKIVFYRNYSLAMLESAVDRWLVGSRNIPDIRLLKWPRLSKGMKAQKGTSPIFATFHAPLPLAVINLIYEIWSQSENENVNPNFRSTPLYENLPIFDGLELFLGNSPLTGLPQRMLALSLQNAGNLCVAFGNISHRTRDNVIGNSHAVVFIETMLPLIGILLFNLNRTKEIYMENTPFLIGKFLNLIDRLHAIWCRNVKEKDPIPPQLLGSSLFASFQMNPTQAFAGIALRIKPYLDWAKTNNSKDVALSRWCIGEIGRISAAITGNIPVRLSDIDKAEMLLGYLASTGKDNSDSSEASSLEESSSPKQ